jgi:DNA polymerase-3 subunit delta'
MATKPKITRRRAEKDIEAQAPQRAAADFVGDFIGNRLAAAYFERAATTGRLAHAYLLLGPEHVGKTELARRVAARLLGMSKPEVHPDFQFVERTADPKTGRPRDNISIAQIHELRGAIARTAVGGVKVAIIAGADALGREAGNALLKTLEEPAGRAVIILTATAPEAVLPTVRSRCETLRLARVPRREIAKALMARGFVPERATTAAALADGRPGLSLTLVGDPTALAELVTWREAVLGMPGRAVTARWQAIEPLFPPKLAFVEAGERAVRFLDLAAEVIRDATLCHAGLAERLVHADVAPAIRVFASALGDEGLMGAAEALTSARRRIEANVSPRHVVENFLLSL